MKNSIKREESHACMNYPERENVRREGVKKFMTWFCIIMQMLIIGMGNLCVVVFITTAYADAIGYYGFWNVPVFLIVGGIVGVTLNVYMKSVQKFSTEL